MDYFFEASLTYIANLCLFVSKKNVIYSQLWASIDWRFVSGFNLQVTSLIHYIVCSDSPRKSIHYKVLPFKAMHHNLFQIEMEHFKATKFQ